jgi:hypothetical protein
MRYFRVILRGIFLNGIGLEVFWPEAMALLAWGLAILALATLAPDQAPGLMGAGQPRKAK